ncbi:MAG: VCBS repeat-containing protein [Verrucomicrobiae bacterium]|nr:VCBS repeat-containing protein [Verrucomicrobiae bacterium]
MRLFRISFLLGFLFSFSFFLGAEEVDFFPVEEYKAGASPMAVAVGDLNGDSAPDLAVVSLLDNAINLFTNFGNGIFTNHITLPSNSPGDLKMADGDGDGDLDLLVVGLGNQTVSVFKNDGNGLFGMIADIYQLPPDAGFPATIEVKDLNGDGWLDFAVGRAGNSSVVVWVYLNNGNGSFTQGDGITLFDSVFSFGCGDFNGDNFPDLAVPEVFFGVIHIYLNNNAAVFNIPSQTINFPNNAAAFAVETADLDGDGDRDLVAGVSAGFQSNKVAIVKNNGTGFFTLTTNYVMNAPFFIDLKDLGRDGDVDIAVACNNTNFVSLLLNQGDGTFASPINLQVGSRPRSIQIQDVDGDGGQDIIVANMDDATLSILRSRFLDISDIPDQISFQNQLAGPYPFQLLGQIGNVVLTAKSSNTNLIPNSNITFGGSGKNRTIALQPLTNQIGGTLITVIASNTVENLTASDSFVLTVMSANNPLPPNQTNIIETNIVINSSTAFGYTLAIKKPKLGKQIRFKAQKGLRKFKAQIITTNSVDKVSYALGDITNAIFTNLDFVPASRLKEMKKRRFEKTGVKYKVANLSKDPKTGKNLSQRSGFFNFIIKIEGVIQTNPVTFYFVNAYKGLVK